jgi:hypothetical protein
MDFFGDEDEPSSYVYYEENLEHVACSCNFKIL